MAGVSSPKKVEVNCCSPVCPARQDVNVNKSCLDIVRKESHYLPFVVPSPISIYLCHHPYVGASIHQFVGPPIITSSSFYFFDLRKRRVYNFINSSLMIPADLHISYNVCKS